MLTAMADSSSVPILSVKDASSMEQSPGTDWDCLPDDPLRLVLLRLPLPDVIRSSNVCRRWRSIIAESRAGESALPWVWTGRSPHFYSLSDDRYYTLDLPGDLRQSLCIGVFQDWLVFTDHKLVKVGVGGAIIINHAQSHTLYNPFSATRIQLPSITCPYVRKLILSSSPDRDPNCQAAFVSSRERDIGFCNVVGKDSEWKRISWPDQHFSDVLFHGGSLLAATVDGELKLVNTESSTMACLLPAPPEQKLPLSIESTFSHGPERAFMLKIRFYRLLVIRGELFMLCSFGQTALTVFKANFELGTWEIAESLKGEAIFVSDTWFASMTPAKSFGIEKDSVYTVYPHHRGVDRFCVKDQNLLFGYLTDAISDIWRTTFKYRHFYMLTPKLNLPRVN